MKVLSFFALFFGLMSGVAHAQQVAQAGPTPVPSSVPYTGTLNANQIVPSAQGTPSTFGGAVNYAFPAQLGLQGQLIQVIGIPGSGTTVAGIGCTNLGGYNGVAYAWCFDTNGNLGANIVNAAANISAYATSGTACVSNGAAGATCPGVNNSSDIGLNLVTANTSSFGWRFLGYTGATPTVYAQIDGGGSGTPGLILANYGIQTAGFNNTSTSEIFLTGQAASAQVGVGATGCGASNRSIWETNTSATIYGIPMTGFGVNCNSTNTLASDASGNLAIAGGFITKNAYVPPVYGATGTALSSSVHVSVGSCTVVTSTCQIVFSGSSAFTSSTTFGCAVGNTNGASSWDGQASGTVVNLYTASGTPTLIAVCTGYYASRPTGFTRFMHLRVPLK